MDARLGVKRAHRQGVSRSRLPSGKDYIRIGIHAPYGTHQGTGVVSVDVDSSDFAGAQSSRLTTWKPGPGQTMVMAMVPTKSRIGYAICLPVLVLSDLA